MDFKPIVLIVVTVIYIYNMALDAVRMRSAKNPVPMNVADIYDEETYHKWRAYHAEKTRFSVITTTVSFVITFLLLLFNVHAAFAGLFNKSDFMQLFAIIVLETLVEVAMLPFEWIEAMKIEEKYGFNRMTPKTFFIDQIKKFIISLALMTGIGALLMVVHQALGDWLILAFAGVMTLFILAIAFLFPFLSKIFNKFTPLEDGELKDKLTGLLEKNGYKVRAINVMDASRRSTKANAYFSGFGKMKTIVLYDTLVEAMTPDEICAVFAHELGHGLHKDTLRNQVLTAVQMIVLAVLAWLTLRTAGVFTSFGFSGINYGFALILIMNVEFALIAPLFGLITNYFSRKAEYAADAHAVKEGYGEALITALKTLARKDYADPAPSPLLIKLEYSHPSLSQRFTAIEKQIKPM